MVPTVHSQAYFICMLVFLLFAWILLFYFSMQSDDVAGRAPSTSEPLPQLGADTGEVPREFPSDTDIGQQHASDHPDIVLPPLAGTTVAPLTGTVAKPTSSPPNGVPPVAQLGGPVDIDANARTQMLSLISFPNVIVYLGAGQSAAPTGPSQPAPEAESTGPQRTSSLYRGVSWHPQTRRWKAQIKVGGKDVNLGRYVTEEEAAQAYDRAALNARQLGGAKLNFPLDTYQAELPWLLSGEIAGPAREVGGSLGECIVNEGVAIALSVSKEMKWELWLRRWISSGPSNVPWEG